jgi:hypothetical protein
VNVFGEQAYDLKPSPIERLANIAADLKMVSLPLS